jgi:hypothetical protein
LTPPTGTVTHRREEDRQQVVPLMPRTPRALLDVTRGTPVPRPKPGLPSPNLESLPERYWSKMGGGPSGARQSPRLRQHGQRPSSSSRERPIDRAGDIYAGASALPSPAGSDVVSCPRSPRSGVAAGLPTGPREVLRHHSCCFRSLRLVTPQDGNATYKSVDRQVANRERCRSPWKVTCSAS